jgi:hypothetical protein
LDALTIPAAVNPGDGVRLEAKASASLPVSYKWYRKAVGAADKDRVALDGIKGVSGANTSVLVFDSVQLTDDAEYQVEISIPGASQATAFRRMDVLRKVAITGQPLSQVRTEGEAGVLLKVSATGDGSLKYRWLRDGVAVSDGNGVSGASTAQIELSPLALDHAGSYQAEVSNAAGAVLSAAAYLQVVPKFAVTVSAPGRVILGGGATLVASTVGADSASFQWYRGSGAAAIAIPGETSAQLNLNPVLATDVCSYSVEAVEVGGAKRKAVGTVSLQLTKAPELLVPLSSQSVAAGANAFFGVVVKYDQPLRYRWYRGTGASQTVIAGATTDKLVISGVKDPADFSTYTVRVTASSDARAFEDPLLYVESSAKLSKQLSVGAGSVTGSGAVGTLSATSFSRWWVFYVDAVNPADEAAPHRSGYWVLERKQVRNASGALVAVTAGRSAWVWADAQTPVEWSAAEQQVQDASANSKSEFSLIASRLGAGVDSFILNGTVETGTGASWVGAPEIAAGSYDATDAEPLTFEMSWDGDRAASSQIYGEGDWDDLLSFLKAELSGQNAAPAGE